MGGRDLYEEALVWDQHGCLSLRPDESAVDDLALYAESGVDFISINVGMDSTPPLDALKVLSAFRHATFCKEKTGSRWSDRRETYLAPMPRVVWRLPSISKAPNLWMEALT